MNTSLMCNPVKLEIHTSKYQNIEQKTVYNYDIDTFNSYQNYLYKRALYGLKGLPQEEVNKMNSAKKHRINNVYQRAQKVLNLYKHQITKQLCDNLLQNLFPKSSLANFLISFNEIEEKEVNFLNFKDLAIDKKQIAELFVKEGVLPKNFFSLDVQDSPGFLPKLKKA